MRKISKEQQLEAVKGWWNTKEVEKWDKQYDNWDHHTVRSLNRRLEKILMFYNISEEKNFKISLFSGLIL